jgi:hypothetical protein
MKVEMLLVTCCLEPSRLEILNQVVDNILQNIPYSRVSLTVFDNGSTEKGTVELLDANFMNLYRAEKNVGYWSAIDWWLCNIEQTVAAKMLSPTETKYTYIIESDMIHYDFSKIWECVDFLDTHEDVGSVRLHEYSIAEQYLFNKDCPRPDSKRGLWQSHTNRFTGLPVTFEQASPLIWNTTFLTQLPALNRLQTMKDVFSDLRTRQSFREPDFQKAYWDRYQKTAILDGGIFHCNLNKYGTKNITGSWSSEKELKKIGYQATRTASIVPQDRYKVIHVR